MVTEIVMPQLGESIAEGTVIKWLVPTGGRVEKDQSLLEVETDKVALEIPSPSTGTLTEVLVQEGQTVPVGTLIARLDNEVSYGSGTTNRVGGVVVRQMPESEDHHSPAVRQLAKEQGVDLAQVKGTGTGGRVTRKDVQDFIARGSAPATGVTPGVEQSMGEDTLPFTPMRKAIAERMVTSRHTSAHVTTFFEGDFSGITEFREGRGLTYLPFVIRAVTRAIRDVPG